MTDDPDVIVRGKTETRLARPKLHKVILWNDDFTPREFVTVVLKCVFGMGPEKAHVVMMTAHRRGACVVAVFTKEVAETKSSQANDYGKEAGFPLRFTTEPEE
ncbi:MAG: ATP-dependent Clp protease adaptor ClpS [Pseudomonadota bacterium]